MNKKFAIVIGLVLCGVLLAGWYYYEQSRWFEVPAHPSIVRMKIDGKRIRIVLHSGSDLSKCINLSVFDSFSRPVTTVDEAVSYYGVPDNIYTDPDSQLDNIEYWRDFGRIVFYRNRHYGGTTFGVSVYPAPAGNAKILCEPLMQYVDPAQPETILVFTDPSGRLLFLVELQGSRVHCLDWLELSITHQHDEPDPYEHIP